MLILSQKGIFHFKEIINFYIDNDQSDKKGNAISLGF